MSGTNSDLPPKQPGESSANYVYRVRAQWDRERAAANPPLPLDRNREVELLRSALRTTTFHPDGVWPADLAAGLLLRAGVPVAAADAERGERFRGMSLPDLCLEALQIEGTEISRDRQDIVRTAVSGVAAPEAFNTAVNTVLLSEFRSTRDTASVWARRTTVSNFKPNRRPLLAEKTRLEPLSRGQTASHLDLETLGEEQFRIHRFARQATLDEQDVLDDNVELFIRTLAEFGAAARSLIPDLAYYHVLENPNLVDGQPWFSAAHGNAATASSLSDTNLQSAIAGMMNQRLNTADGQTPVNLDIAPLALLVPPPLMYTARKLVREMHLNDGQDLRVLAEPRLETGVHDPLTGTPATGSASTWYLSGLGPSLEIATRTAEPQIRRFTLKDGRWGVGWDIAFDIGAKAVAPYGIRRHTA